MLYSTRAHARFNALGEGWFPVPPTSLPLHPVGKSFPSGVSLGETSVYWMKLLCGEAVRRVISFLQQYLCDVFELAEFYHSFVCVFLQMFVLPHLLVGDVDAVAAEFHYGMDVGLEGVAYHHEL